MLDTLLIVIVFVLSYFSLIRKSSKDRQTLLLDRLERYLDKVEAEERRKEEDEEDVRPEERKRREQDNEEEEGSETEVDEEEEEEESKLPSTEDALSLLSEAFMGAAGGTSEDTEKLVQASRELLKENLGAFMNEESQKEFAKIFGQLTEFVKL